ncbi:MAG: ergothioneine biosynthesis protein EgtB [Lautropia sp.]
MNRSLHPLDRGAAHAGALRRRVAQTRERSLALARPLDEEDCALQSMPDASPVKWHLAHTTWFFEVFVLEPFEAGFSPFDPDFRVLFNSYYEGVGERHPRPERGLISRPGLARIRSWRQDVDARIDALLADTGLSAHARAQVERRVELGIHHEQQHQELILTDLKHLFSRNPASPAYLEGWPLKSATSQPARWVAYDGGLVECGAAEDGVAFSFDNEGPRHRVWLEPFELAVQPVTNEVVLAFIADGGYRDARLWTSMGWDWVRAEAIAAPGYWRHEGGSDHSVFTLRGRVPVSPQVPACHLSWFEAEAIARWAGARLPTEFEWEHAAVRQPVEGNLADAGVYHPVALQDAPPPGRLAQVYGDVWEWTASAYLPYPGFRTVEGAIGEYNGKFMCNQFVLRGGSCATPASHLRATYRNFFPPQARWQFSGFRLAR